MYIIETIETKFIKLIKTGNLEELQQFYNNNTINISTFKDDPFLIALNNHQLETALWLASIQQPTNTHVDEYDDIINMFKKFIFIGLIKKGNLEKIQDFYSLNTSLNISANREEAFRTACVYGHLHVVEWLLQTKNDIDVSVCSENTFKKVCTKGHLEIAKLLLNIVPNLKSTIDYYLLQYICDEAGEPTQKLQETIRFIFNINLDICIQAIDGNMFHIACTRNLWELVRWFISIKPSVIIEAKELDAEDKEYATYYHVCSEQQVEIAELLKPTDIVVN